MADDPRFLKCSGCGQVGMLAQGEAEELRRRRVGFYRLERKSGGAVIACCRCQQTQPEISTLP